MAILTLIFHSFLSYYRLKESEAKLDVIVKEQGSNVDSFVKLVKENRETLDAFKVRTYTTALNDCNTRGYLSFSPFS